MTPREYEAAVAAHYASQGYETELGAGTSDWGVDVFATRGREKLASQAKMYGATTRSVNREQVMQLHGAAAWFDCTGAVIATDGRLMPDAEAVARKLGISILRLQGTGIAPPTPRRRTRASDFSSVWEQHVMPLAGRTLVRADGSRNEIVAVDWAGVTRVTSKGNRQLIKVEIFRLAIERVLAGESVSRDWINQMYPGRASSGIMLILAQVPLFEVGGRPECCTLRSAR